MMDAHVRSLTAHVFTDLRHPSSGSGSPSADH